MSDANSNNPGQAVTEKKESNRGKMITGGVAALIGAVVGYGLVGGAGIFASAVVFGLIGAVLGAAFD
jgi:hypothetical protein